MPEEKNAATDRFALEHLDQVDIVDEGGAHVRLDKAIGAMGKIRAISDSVERAARRK